MKHVMHIKIVVLLLYVALCTHLVLAAIEPQPAMAVQMGR